MTYKDLKRTRSHLAIIKTQLDELAYLDKNIYKSFLKGGRTLAEFWLDEIAKQIITKTGR